MFIGDALANLCKYVGHIVLKISHIGDFGLQFGMIINYIIKNNITIESIKDDPSMLQQIYSDAKKEFDNQNDKNFNTGSYKIIQSIHNDEKSDYLDLWQEIRDISLASYEKIFNKVNIKQDVIGESFYKKYANNMVHKCMNDFPEIVYKNTDGRIIAFGDKKIIPLTLMKSDGAYTYDTTDLCAIEYRVKEQKADNIFYVVDTGQALHFKQLFAVAYGIGFDKVVLEHINFGIILGEDKKRIRSRDGDTPKLIDMFQDCFNETKKVFDSRETKHDDSMIESVSLSSLRYANLTIKRESDFMFSLDKILSFKGNTYMYILYAYIRCKSIMRKLNTYDKKSYIVDNKCCDSDYVFLRKLLKFRNALETAFDNRDVSYLCEYLYNLVENFHSYYKSTRILNFEDDILISVRCNALELIKLCQSILFDCFNILGLDCSIEAL
jgi:arginyl-tRNA synthetase